MEAKKKRKLLGQFTKDKRLFERLGHYIGDLDNSTPRNARTCPREQPIKRRFVIDRGSKTSDDSDKDYDEACKEYEKYTPPNVLNNSMRNIYSNAKQNQSPKINDNVSKAAIDKINTPGKKTKKNPITLKTSTITFSNIGGLDEKLEEISELLLHLTIPNVYKHLGVRNNSRGILLNGPPGSGKTMIAHAIAGELGLPLIEIASTELVSGISGGSESNLRDLFECAISNSPCLLFIDEIDIISSKRETAEREMDKRITAQLQKCMDELANLDDDTQVVVVGATNRLDSIDPALRRAGRFEHDISIGIPDEEARSKILQVVCKDLRLSPNIDIEWLARSTPGYVGADLMAISQIAAKNAVTRTCKELFKKYCNSTVIDAITSKQNMCLLKQVSLLKQKNVINNEQLENVFIEAYDFKTAISVYVPSSKREGFATIPLVTWEEVGALDDIKKKLQKSVIWPIKYRKEHEKLCMKPSSGVLLCGPKGCGKTLLAKAIANECSINFLSVKGPELLNKYVGESERAVRECFQRARNSAPCVIFFDEIDALCPQRSSSDVNKAAERVVAQFLAEIDGVEDQNKHVFVMGATNRPEDVDSAMQRPGRLDKVIYVGVPDAEDRLDILKAITKNGTKPKFASDVDLKMVAFDHRCHGFSGADLKSLVREASSSAMERIISHKESDIGESSYAVNAQDFEHAFSEVTPSIFQKDLIPFAKSLKSSMQVKKCL